MRHYNTRRLPGRIARALNIVPLPYRIVTLQLITALGVAALLLSVSRFESLSALAAGLVCVVPNGYFAWATTNARSAPRLLGQGVAKFVLTVFFLAGTFAVMKPAPLGFFSAFIAVQAMTLMGPLLTTRLAEK